jgi:hypothetical protein
MIGDKLLKFDENRAMAALTTPAASTNIFDFGEGLDEWFNDDLPNIGDHAQPLVLRVFFKQGGDLTNLTGFVVDVEYSDDEAFTNPIKLQSFFIDPDARGETGEIIAMGHIAPRRYRYVRLFYTLTVVASTTLPAAITFSAGIYQV